MVRKYGPGIRVNAIAPGFFLAEMNRPFMVKEDGSFTPRGQAVIDRTPVARFGDPQTCRWDHLVVQPRRHFVTGAVIAIDGGFGAFSGV